MKNRVIVVTKKAMIISAVVIIGIVLAIVCPAVSVF
jgi:hypothetical protein